MNQQAFIAKARSILGDNAGRRMIGGQSSGPRISTGHLARVSFGDFRVFKRSMFAKFKEYGIVLCVDCSGSMHGYKMESASQCTTKLLSAFESSGVVKSEVVLFNNTIKVLNDAEKRRVAREERFIQGIAERGELTGFYGATHDGHAIFEGVRLLKEARTAGKIIVVVCDGYSECSGCSLDGCPQNFGTRTKKASLYLQGHLARAQKEGCIVLGVGIGVDLKNYEEKYKTTVYDVDNLFRGVAGMLERNLIRG